MGIEQRSVPGQPTSTSATAAMDGSMKAEGGPWAGSRDLEVHELSTTLEVTPGDESEKLGTEYDQRGMRRMGKKQELRREFQFFSIWGFAVILGCSWEYVFMWVPSARFWALELEMNVNAVKLM
jgi:hypothetical protein